MVLVATDEQVYSTLQAPLDRFLGANTFRLVAEQMRQSYDRPNELLQLVSTLEQTGEFRNIAESWLRFDRMTDENGLLPIHRRFRTR